MDPTSRKQPSSAAAADPSLLKTPIQYPKRNSLHKAFALTKPTDPPKVDAHLQAKFMSLSANAGPSISKNPTIPKSHHKPKNMEKKKEKGGGGVEEKEQEQEKEDEKRTVLLITGTGSRRSSFCGSELDLVAFLSGVGAKVVAKDMPPFMQIHAVSCAKKTFDGLDKFSSKALAFSLKKEFDVVYGPAWHCIVGTSFGSFVTHSVGGFIYFSLGKLYILLFKTSVQKAE